MRTIESAREEFVKKLKTDLSQNLDFDFTRPEMCAAFVIKYFDETQMFITKDKDLQLAIATRTKSKCTTNIHAYYREWKGYYGTFS